MPGALQGSIAIVWTSVFLYVQSFVDSVGYGQDITIIKILKNWSCLKRPEKLKSKKKTPTLN